MPFFIVCCAVAGIFELLQVFRKHLTILRAGAACEYFARAGFTNWIDTTPDHISVMSDTLDISAPGPAAKKPVSKLSSLVSRLSKKPKMTILNKTSLDWDKYKSDKGIEGEYSEIAI